MRFLHLFFGGFVITAACGGASSTPLDDGGLASDGGGDGQTTTDATTNPDVNPPKGDAAPGNDAAPGLDSGACPNEAGGYKISLAGLGCGDTSTSVNECIQQSGCTIQLDFNGGSGKGLKGSTPIQSDGSFTNAAIEEGSAQRTGCIGTWNDQTSTLVVTCGGTNSTQSCVATLVRTSATCI